MILNKHYLILVFFIGSKNLSPFKTFKIQYHISFYSVGECEEKWRNTIVKSVDFYTIKFRIVKVVEISPRKKYG
jgi:hypothetical protein